MPQLNLLRPNEPDRTLQTRSVVLLVWFQQPMGLGWGRTGNEGIGIDKWYGAIEIGYGFGLGLVRVIQWQVEAMLNESK